MVTLTEDNDEFYGEVEGGEIVFALGGDDFLMSIAGNYELHGGMGNDKFALFFSNFNSVFGDDGDDVLDNSESGNTDNNVIQMGAGSDYVTLSGPGLQHASGWCWQ
jgi:Ca2+-binding RTX toxin-like protein